jgi:regulator of sigma E protease
MHYFLYYFLPFIVVLGILIFFHELGHFLVAKYFGVKVLKFSLGFGYKVVGKKIGETEYVISSIPLGGYVKLLGENDEEASQMPPSEAARSFNNQHVLKRMAIVLAGPFFNLFLALFVYCCFYAFSGMDVMIAEVGQVRENSPAQQAGMMKGDVIVAVDEKGIASWPDIKENIQDSAGTPLVITVDRGGALVSMTLVPEEAVEKTSSARM